MRGVKKAKDGVGEGSGEGAREGGGGGRWVDTMGGR